MTPNRGHQSEELGRLDKLEGKLIIRGLQHVRDGKEGKEANLLARRQTYTSWDFDGRDGKKKATIVTKMY